MHLLLRIPAIPAPLIDIIAAHNQIVAEYGEVYLGIMGRQIGEPRRATLRHEAQRVSTYLYVVQKSASSIEAFRARLLDIVDALPEGSIERLVPEYYRREGIVEKAKLWVRISRFESVSDIQLQKLYVETSGRPVTELLRGMASLAVVCSDD